ncbi:MAG: hypothetical protein LUE14_11700 [Clostridiales bacterium]|nr:hypothetical protein [Clostridiales bacterium]
MKKNLKQNRFFPGVLLALVLSVSLAFPVFAEGTEGSLTLNYILSDCTFFVYRVADYDNDSYDLTDDFASQDVNWTELDELSWYDLAESLEGMTVSEGIDPVQSGQTDASYEVTFTGLQRGLYLILADEMTADGYVYTVTPMLIVLTDEDGDGLADAQEITVSKYTMMQASSSDDGSDDSDESDSPSDSDDSGESDSSSDSDDSGESDSSSDSDDFGETDSSSDSDGSDESDSSSGSGTSDESDSSSGTGTSGDSDTSSGTGSSSGSGTLSSILSSSSNLPQTGMNWLPVIFLVLAGMVCLVIGRVQSRCGD